MNKKTIYITIIVILLIILAVIIALIIQKKNSIATEPPVLVSKQQMAMELLENDNLRYYYYYGDIQTTDAYIEENGEYYYYVTDEKINNLEISIDELIQNTYTEVSSYRTTPEDPVNEYLQFEDKLYVKKITNPCQRISNYNLNNIAFAEESENKSVVIFDDASTTIYLEDGKWKLMSTMQYCLDE